MYSISMISSIWNIGSPRERRSKGGFLCNLAVLCHTLHRKNTLCYMYFPNSCVSVIVDSNSITNLPQGMAIKIFPATLTWGSR